MNNEHNGLIFKISDSTNHTYTNLPSYLHFQSSFYSIFYYRMLIKNSLTSIGNDIFAETPLQSL